MNSNIIVAKQSSKIISEHIKKTIDNNKSEKFFFDEDYSFSSGENDFYYEDKFGGIKLPKPNLNGEFQLENISTAIATLRGIKQLNIYDNHIKSGITKITSVARLQEITEGKLKDLVKENRLIIDGSHNPLGAKVLNDYLESLHCEKHIILGMMANKDHREFIRCLKI